MYGCYLQSKNIFFEWLFLNFIRNQNFHNNIEIFKVFLNNKI